LRENVSVNFKTVIKLDFKQYLKTFFLICLFSSMYSPAQVRDISYEDFISDENVLLLEERKRIDVYGLVSTDEYFFSIYAIKVTKKDTENWYVAFETVDINLSLAKRTSEYTYLTYSEFENLCEIFKRTYIDFNNYSSNSILKQTYRLNKDCTFEFYLEPDSSDKTSSNKYIKVILSSQKNETLFVLPNFDLGLSEFTAAVKHLEKWKSN